MPFSNDTVLAQEHQRLSSKVEQLRGKYEALMAQLRAADDERSRWTGEAMEINFCLDALREMEKTWRDQFQQGLAAVVSDGMTSVFGTPVEVVLETKMYRDATSIDLRVIKDGVDTDLDDARGGTVMVLLAFLLRVLMTIAVRPALYPIVLLDEPFAHVSPDYRPKVAELLTQLHNKLGLQFILVTQEHEYLSCATHAYEVKGAGQARAHMLSLETGERT